MSDLNNDQVDVTIVDFSDLAIQLEGDDYYKQPVVYTFGGGRKEFLDPGEDGSLYNPPV